MEEEKTEIIANIEQPNDINVPLFLHQLKSIEEMEKLENTKEIALNSTIYLSTKLGILGDLPGYGKSLSVIGLIARTKHNTLKDTYVVEKVRHHPYVSMSKIEILPQLNCSLILVNISLLSQWMFELNRTLLSYTAICKPSEIEDIDISKYDVVIVSNNVYNLFSQVFRKKCWKRFIVDEPASLKLTMDETYAQFYWLITGTPNELYLKRRNGFLNELLPEEFDTFQHIILKNEDQLVKNSYEMPITRNIFYQCAGNLSTLFDGILPEHIIEMIQAGNVVGVLNALNAEEEISIFEAFRLKKMKRLEELSEDRSDRVEKIKTIKYHLQLLDERIFRYVAQNHCMICKNPFEKIFVLSCCQHLYCGNCVESDCPLCKAKSQEIIKIPLKLKEFDSNESESLKEIKNEKTKIDTLMDIVGTAENKKILIFSNYNETFTVIKKFLDEKKLSYLELRGTKEKRDNAIDSYKTGTVNILLLNTIHSGAGLNLQETSDIILYHRLHEYQKIQVIGRANRIGRKIQLNVHYLE